MKKILLFAIVTAFILQCCDGPNVRKHHFFKSYITEYTCADSIKLDISRNGNIKIKINKGISYSFRDKGAFKVKFDNLCKENNDHSYNKKRNYIVFPHWGYTSAARFTNIEVVSDKDFDAAHPAGKSLKDIVRFVSNSPKKFIDSGYSSTFNWYSSDLSASFTREPEAEPTNHSEAGNYFPIDVKLSEFTENDGKILGYGSTLGFLLFDAEPTTNKEHTLTVTIYTAEGKKHTNTITKVF